MEIRSAGADHISSAQVNAARRARGSLAFLSPLTVRRKSPGLEEPGQGLETTGEEALALAREMRNPTAMVTAINEKGVLSGKRVERCERDSPGEFDWIENATAEQLEVFIVGKDAERLQ
jgi:hypothetical protein